MARHTPLAVVNLVEDVDIELDKSQSRLASKTWWSYLRRDESIGDVGSRRDGDKVAGRTLLAVDVWPCTR